ncbi:hypothetical protein LJC27_07735 [Christensenellaceae bacterium OttesenSCG-928-M15]|nr:hypothetical protein [Christensenellaceae bacterium OttesenSCG-928-M15]
MNARKAIRTIRRDPEAFDPIYKLSTREAKKRVMAHGYKPFHQMMRELRAQNRIGEKDWAEIEPVVLRSEEKARRKEMHPLLRLFRYHGRVAVAALVLLLLLGFFTLVPVGKTVAQDIFNLVARITDRQIIFDTVPIIASDFTYTEEPVASLPPAAAISQAEFDAAASRFEALTGQKMMYFESEGAEITHVSVVEAVKFIVAETHYRVRESSLVFMLTQEWYIDPHNMVQTKVIAGRGDVEYENRMLLDEYEMLCMLDHAAGHFVGLTTIANNYVEVLAQFGIDIEALLSSLVIQ